MIFLFVISSFIYLIDAPYYPLRVKGNKSSVDAFVKIINRELGSPDIIKVDRIAETNEYGIQLRRRNPFIPFATRQNRFLCAMNFMLNDSSKSFRLILVENQERILIGDGISGVIDMADVAKFDNNTEEKFTAGMVLLHEIYEQYYLQVRAKLKPGRVSHDQLKKAHLAATQKESNLFDLLMVKTESSINDEFIYIEFTSRIDNSTSEYYAFHRNGNIDRVEKKLTYDK